jgi:putative transposase
MSWGLVMPAPLSRDLRERIVAAIRDGSSMRYAAARFSVSPSSAIKLMARFRATGSVPSARYGGHHRPILSPHEDLLRALVAEKPDITPWSRSAMSCGSGAAHRCVWRRST